jgi:hypothetical protein
MMRARSDALEIGWKIKSALAAVRDSVHFLWDLQREQIVCGLSLLLVGEKSRRMRFIGGGLVFICIQIDSGHRNPPRRTEKISTFRDAQKQAWVFVLATAVKISPPCAKFAGSAVINLV